MNPQPKLTPFEEGRNAALAGKPLKSCPYNANSPVGRRWIGGWGHGHDHPVQAQQSQETPAHATSQTERA